MASSQIINEEADHNRDWGGWTKVKGIKFKPTPEVLVGHYLARKVSGCTDGPIFPLIPEVNVYQHEPSKLKSKAYDFGDGKMYFFSRITKKCKNGLIHHRIADGGFWKTTGKRTTVSSNRDGRKIAATVWPLTYYRNVSGEEPIKTHWLMKEYMLLEGQQNDKESVTLCVVYSNDKNQRRRESENEVLYENEKRQNSLPLPNVEEPEGSCLNLPDNINRSWGFNLTDLDNNHPLDKSNSNAPASTPELPSPKSDQNMQSVMAGSSGAPADSNMSTPNYCPSPFTALDLQNWLQAQEADGSLDYQYPDLFGKP